jgi:hypothetical protein
MEQVNERQRPKRPFSVTLLALGVLSIAVIQMIRFILALNQWDFLDSLPGVSPLYLAATGLIWATLSLPLAVGLWFGQSWAPMFTLIGGCVFIFFIWFDRLFVAALPLTLESGSSWPFSLAVTTIILALTIWILSRPKAKVFFRREA